MWIIFYSERFPRKLEYFCVYVQGRKEGRKEIILVS